MAEKRVSWCLIPPGILCRRDLLPSEKILIGRIISLTNERGYCYASNAYLGEQLGMTKGSAANMIGDLHQRGFLKIDLTRNENHHITERRIYPIYEDLPIHPQVMGYSPTGEGGIHPQVKGGIHPQVKGSIRVKSIRVKSTSEALKASDDVLKLSRLLYSEILINESSTRLPHITNEKEIEHKIQTWAKDINKLIRIDRQNPAIVEEVIRWTQQDSFWGPNVQSGQKLREKWDALVARKNQRVSKPQFHDAYSGPLDLAGNPYQVRR